MFSYSQINHLAAGWTSLDYPWMVTVTLASADTLTRGGGGRVDIPGLSMDGHGYSGIRRYSDNGGGGGKGGHPWTIHGWSLLLWHPRIL